MYDMNTFIKTFKAYPYYKVGKIIYMPFIIYSNELQNITIQTSMIIKGLPYNADVAVGFIRGLNQQCGIFQCENKTIIPRCESGNPTGTFSSSPGVAYIQLLAIGRL